MRQNVDGAPIQEKDSLSSIATSVLLTDVSNWHVTMSETFRHVLPGADVVTFSVSDIVPPSIQRASPSKIHKMPQLTADPSMGGQLAEKVAEYTYPQHSVAIVGMACKYAGVDSLDEFWDVISKGASMHGEVPEDRWVRTGLRRTKEGSRYYGNFVRDADAFDHRFFKKSAREAAAMDPQQRILLQAAYQAVESSGYLTERDAPEDVGCYIGVATTDYHDNLASHAPTAFSAIGELRAFLCGRISHHFGWTGPSMTYDTACSASMVAIDAACRSIQTGQCSRALAGGVSLNSSPNLWENLRAANFLSPTGPTKPFDAAGDGYCRGEGVGLIFLKKLSEAVKDGDFIYGVIAGTGVNQCRNDTYITVPNGSSQVDLYKKVLADAGVKPYDVSYIESHGTGTAKGDPTEMASLRSVFGGPSRDSIVSIGSVKGNVGHCEASSGVASVIKTVLAMNKSTIPPLANHHSLNPNIQPLAVDKMCIPLSPQPWDMHFKAALVNNYGAAGSNAALVLCQPPKRSSTRRSLNEHSSALSVVPVCIYAHTEQSVKSYCQALCDSLPAEIPTDEIGFLQNLAFNLVKKQNRTLSHRFITSVSTVEALKAALRSPDQFIQQHQNNKAETSSVVLSFGGQTNNHVGLSQHLYFESALLRFHLENCNRAIRRAGYKSIFPAIFQTKPVTDVVSLHCLFFAIQYASANAWMDAGVTPAAVVGHSFGQLSAMCISGMLSLDDAVKLVAGRASLMQKYWGGESGSMVSVEADTKTTEGVIEALSSQHGLQAEIACYNAPTGHVIVGTSKAMDAVEQVCKASTQPIRHKRLQVTNGFHSEFTEPLIPHLEKLASGLQISQPHIHLEPCSKEPTTWQDMTPAFIANHTRAPVYFQAAVERLEARIGSCVWLEAGSNSSVAAMARRALAGSSVSHTYHGTNLNGKEALNRLAETMVTLWKTMPTIEVGPFYRKKGSARAPFRSIDLPPYQFEKQRHWMTWKDNVDNTKDSAPSQVTKSHQESKPEILRQVSGGGKGVALFVVDPRSEEFQHFVKGHAVLDQPLCPADLYVELAARATRCLQPSQGFIPSVEKLSIVAPLGIDPDKEIHLSMTATEPTSPSWSFIFTSGPRASAQTSDRTKHASGLVKLTSANDLSFKAEVARYEKLVGSSRATAFLSDHQAEGMKGALVYQVFSKVVAYADYYQGVKAVASRGDEVGAQIVVPAPSQAADSSMILDPVAVDNFVQVAGIKVNCLNPCPVNQVYICGHIERVQATQTFMDLSRLGQGQKTWHVFAQCTPVTEKVYHNDIYVFSEDKKLAMIILGVQFTRVSIMSLASAISQSNRAGSAPKKQSQEQSFYDKAIEKLRGCREESTAQRFEAPQIKEPSTVDVFAKLTDLLHEVAEVPKASVTRSSTFEGLGVDSLLTTEVFSAVTEKFGIQIPHHKVAELQDVESLVTFLSTPERSPSPALSTPGLSTPAFSTPGLQSPFSHVSGAVTPFTEVSGLSTPAECVAEKPTVSQGSKNGDAEQRLAQVLCQLLEIPPSSLDSKSSLEDQGLDSLLTVELTSALEEAFACKFGAGSVHADMTYNQLKQVVMAKVSGSMAGSLVKATV
jgi:acyl carrier protein